MHCEILETELKEYIQFHSEQDVLNSYISGIVGLEKLSLEKYKQRHLVCGGMVAFDDRIVNFLNCWNKNETMILLSEVTGQYRRFTEQSVNFPAICTPHLLANGIILENMSITDPYYEHFCKKNHYLHLVAKHFEGMYDQKMGDGYAFTWTYFANLYISKLLEILVPQKVLLWNQFYPFHELILRKCRERRISVEFIEYGALPGTYEIESTGQLGNSKIARKGIIFQKLSLTKADIEFSKRIIRHIKDSGFTRYKTSQISELGSVPNIIEGRPTIVFYGQNDEESGIYPRTALSKMISPMFNSSFEAAEYINRLAIKNNWNYFFKPHPTWVKRHGIPENTTMNVLVNVDILELLKNTDLSITISSQMAYMSLINNVPVVTLGRFGMTNKKCSYEPKKKSRIEKNIITALAKGYTDKQDRYFISHVAFMLKTVLYDDCEEKKIQYGRKI